MATHKIEGVEIFSVGKWNGDEYTHADLQEMVKAFEETKHGARPYIKLGHDNKQKLVQDDGLPAAGWVDKVYIKGDKLVADIVDIPKKVYALIKSKAYRKVSSEIFWNITIGEKKYKRMLAAVALLGADTPGVMNLNDILAMYKIYSNNCEKIGSGSLFEIKEFNLTEPKEGKVMEKTEKELELEKQLADKEAQIEAEKKEFALKQEEAQKELEALKAFKAEAEAKEAQLLAEKEEIRIEKFVSDLCTEGLCTPAMKDIVKELCGPEKKEYTAGKLSKEDSIKELLKLFKAGQGVNLQEGSSKGDKEKQDEQSAMDKKAKEYMKEKNCSYSQALKEIMKDKK